MTPDDVSGKVIAILAQQAMIESGAVRMDASLQELGLDSLGLVESIFAIEEAFDIAIPFNANAPEASPFDTSTVAAVVGAVATLVAAKPA
jgi:acyl carrier protein